MDRYFRLPITQTHCERASSHTTFGSRNHSALSISSGVTALSPSGFLMTGSGCWVKLTPSRDQYRYCSCLRRTPPVGCVASTMTAPAPKPAVFALSTTADPVQTGKLSRRGMATRFSPKATRSSVVHTSQPPSPWLASEWR